MPTPTLLDLARATLDALGDKLDKTGDGSQLTGLAKSADLAAKANASDLLGVAQDTLTALDQKVDASDLATPSFQRFSVADGNAIAGQTALTVAAYTPGALLVFVNGSKLPTNAYTATSGNSVILADPVQATDMVEVLSWLMTGVLNAAPISHQHNVSDILGLAAFVTSYLASLPTSLPATPGQPWWNGGMLSKS